MMEHFKGQPRAVWAVAFAAVISFMGLGLVDPILPAIAKQLHADHSQVEMLFTTYFACTGISMLFSSFVASKIGAKYTLLTGLGLIVIFAAAAGSSNTVGAIAGFRAGWGFGNALFIATALSVIVGAASGGTASAVMIYEAALGLGISMGPLVGGTLGGVSWRAPFFGVAVLMLIGFVFISTFLPRTPPPKQAMPVLAPLRALKLRPARASALVALFYNFGFFTLLAYTPLVLGGFGVNVHQLGFIFTGWGLLLAGAAVFAAPAIGRRWSDSTGLAFALVGIVAVMLVMAFCHTSEGALIIALICSGFFLGIVNTLMTGVVMEATPLPRSVASAAYSFARFTGGAIAPWLAGQLSTPGSFVAKKLSLTATVQLPFFFGGIMTAISILALWYYRKALVPHYTGAPAHDPAELEDAIAGEGGIELDTEMI